MPKTSNDPNIDIVKKKVHEKKSKTKEKDICPAAVKIITKGKVNDYISDNKTVYCLTLDKEKDKKAWYANCTRPLYECKEFCYKHPITYDDGGQVLLFQDDIVDKKGAYLMTEDDILITRNTNVIEDTTQSDNPNPILRVTITSDLKEQIKNYLDKPKPDKPKKNNQPDKSNKKKKTQ